MKSVRRWLKSFFRLSGSQANGMMVLLPLLFLLIMSEPLWRWWQIRHWKPDPQDVAIMDSLAKAWLAGTDSAQTGSGAIRAHRPEYFQFDPNQASFAEFVRLGFDARLAHRIENYRRKGGVFKAKQDLLKIYGMDSVHYQRLARYIVIAREFSARRRPGARDSLRVGPGLVFEKRGAWANRSSEPFDLNLADTARLEVVRGIGPKLSRRIIKYRSSLGGFVHVGQLQEVFGLDSVTLEKIMQEAFVAPDFLPDRIDLNQADENVMEAHPYITRQEARTIVAYRFQHGRFTAVSDLRKLPMFTEEKVRRLEPYLKTGE